MSQYGALKIQVEHYDFISQLITRKISPELIKSVEQSQIYTFHVTRNININAFINFFCGIHIVVMYVYLYE